MNILNLTADERVVMECLVDDALDGEDSNYPLPRDRVDVESNQISSWAEPRRLDSAGRRLIEVALVQRDSLTISQKRYLTETMLEKLAGLCLAKVKLLTGDSTDQVLDRVKQLLK